MHARAPQAGGRTQFVGFVVFLIVLLTQAVMMPLFSPLPRATLAGVIFNAAISLIHVDEIIFMIRVRG